MSSPGAGKTVLLEQTLKALKDKFKIAVIEGDMTTELDVDRLRKYSIPVIAINTGRSCHLDSKEDKPFKYSVMFQEADCWLITKTDLAPYLDIDCDRIADNVRQMNPHVTIIYLSGKTGEGLQQWFDWVQSQINQKSIT